MRANPEDECGVCAEQKQQKDGRTLAAAQVDAAASLRDEATLTANHHGWRARGTRLRAVCQIRTTKRIGER